MSDTTSSKPLPAARFFTSAEAFRHWLEGNHGTARDIWLGLYRKGSSAPSVTYAEAVDEAICFGWIDSQIRRLDAQRYALRFTPRRPRSSWTVSNTRRFEELRAAGRVAAAGETAFATRRNSG